MKSFKKNLIGNITLICIISFSIVHLTLLTLNLFNVLNFALPKNFSYITAYILMIFCFALYFAGFWIEAIKSLKVPNWFKIVFYVGFFIFTNVYYILDLFNNLFFVIVFIAYISFILNICALSLYFNINKDEKNKLKSTTKELTFGTTTYSLSLCSLALFIISAIEVLFFKAYALALLSTFVIEMLAMIIATSIMSIIFATSHKKSKLLINGCLIKIVPKTITPSQKKQ